MYSINLSRKILGEYNNESIFNEYCRLFSKEKDNWKLNKNESLFYLLSGYAYQTMKKRNWRSDNDDRKNGQILYLYDAKLTNPNGDPDEENRPRMDYEREINLVSDLRLKRYIRDYLLDIGYPLYIQNRRCSCYSGSQAAGSEGKSDIVQTAKDTFIDVRLFGATIPVKKDNHSITGAVQFNWGIRLTRLNSLKAA